MAQEEMFIITQIKLENNEIQDLCGNLEFD